MANNNFIVQNGLSVGGAAGANISVDPVSGAMYIIPAATTAIPNPTAMVFTSNGTITTVTTVAGVANVANIATAANIASAGTGLTTFSNITVGNIYVNGSTGTNGQFLSSNGAGLSWVTLSASSISNGTSNVIVNSGNITIGVNGNQVWTVNPSAVTISGNVNIPTQLTTTTLVANVGTLNVGGNISYGPDFGLIGSFVANVPNYAYVAVQNLNTGGNASASFTAYNNTGTSYIDVGVNSSNFNAVSSGYVNNALNTASASYAYSYGGDMVVGTWNNNGIHFITNAVTTAGDSMFIAGNGNVYISGNLTVSGNTNFTYTTTNFVTESANLVQTAYLAGNATTNSGTITLQNNIVPGANTSINLGSTTAWWNNIYGVTFVGTSTSAKYADLAENYRADKFYNPGTVLMFGGANEVTLADADTTRVAGVVSTNPAHLMNGGLNGASVAAVALVGRVPCNVVGPVAKGDLMVSAGFGFAKVNNNAQPGQVIGKALADFPIAAKGVIEVVVGRL